MSKITYENKEQLNTNENIPAKNKCMASDLNEIKSIVNENDTNALYKKNVKTTKTDSDNDTYSCNYINSALEEHYSTEEQVIGEYLGKPLYRKIIKEVRLGSTKDVWNTISVIPNIDNSNIANLSFMVYKNNYEHYINLFKTVDFMVTNDHKLQAKHYDDYYSNCDISIVLEYTKTTD